MKHSSAFPAFIALLIIWPATARANDSSPDPDNEPHKDTHFWRAVDGFLTALEKKKPQEFFNEAWELAEKANKARFGDDVPDDPRLSFGALQVKREQREMAVRVWKLIEKFAPLDAEFSPRYTELGYTVDFLRGSMNMSAGFTLTTEARIQLGLKERGKYSYLAFRHDMIERFGFGENQTADTPVVHLARASTRTRLKKALDEKMGNDRSTQLRDLIGDCFVEVAGAAIFTHAEASAQLARANP